MHREAPIAIFLLIAASNAAIADRPTTGTGSAPALTITAGAARVVSFRARSDWVLEFSGDLEHWSPQARGNAGWQAVTVPGNLESAFFRLRIGGSESCHSDDGDDHKKRGKGRGKWKKH